MFLDFTIKCFKITLMMVNNKIILTLSTFTITGPIIMIIGMILGIIETDQIRYRIIILGLLFCVLLGFALQVIFMAYKNLITQIMTRILSTHPNFPKFIDKSITQRAEKVAEEKSAIEILIFVLSSSLCVFCPYLYFITKPGIRLDHPDVQVTPFLYTSLKDGSISNFLVWKFIELWFAFTGLSAYYIFTVFLIYTIANLKSHIEEVNRQLNNVIDTHICRYMMYNEFSSERFQTCGSFVLGNTSQKKINEFEKSIDEELAKIIVYLNFIHGYVMDITRLLHKPMTALLAWYISSTVLFAITFLKITEDSIRTMKMLSLMIHSTMSLRLFCDEAESIYNTNGKMMDSFYNTSWYYLLPRARKKLSIILALCQKKYVVKSLGMYVVNLNLFIFAVRTVYSVMNVVLVMEKK